MASVVNKTKHDKHNHKRIAGLCSSKMTFEDRKIDVLILLLFVPLLK